MKKLTAIILAAAMLALAPVSVFADVIDWVLYTDIRTYIGGVEITSYNIKGNTAVVVEDLKDYGFKVVWDGDTRTLSVARDAEASVAGGEVTRTEGEVGARAMEVYSTDIVTYLDGNVTESYNVGGRTIVYVDALAALYSSEYYWDPDARTLTMTLSGSVKAPEPKPEKTDTEPSYTISDGVYVNKWAGISFPIKGETKTDTSIFGDSGLDVGEMFMTFDEETTFAVTAFTVIPNEDIAPMFELFDGEEAAALMAAAIMSADSDDTEAITSKQIGNNTWWIIDMTESVGTPAKALFRIIDGKMFFVMAMAEDVAYVDEFFGMIEPTSNISNETSKNNNTTATKQLFFRNQTGIAIDSIYISSSELDTWGNPINNTKIVANSTIQFSFDSTNLDGIGPGRYDIGLVDEIGLNYDIFDVSLAYGDTITIFPSNGENFTLFVDHSDGTSNDYVGWVYAEEEEEEEEEEEKKTSESYDTTGGYNFNFPLHLYSYDGKVYLGKLVTNKYDSDSIWNSYGTYGSKYSTESIWNEYGTYGGKYSNESAFNKYATEPPKIVDNNGNLVGYLTTNQYTNYGYTIEQIRQFLINNGQ